MICTCCNISKYTFEHVNVCLCQMLLFLQMATEAFGRIYPDEMWMSIAAIEEGKTADDPLAKVWAGLGSCASDGLLKKAVEKLMILAGDPLLWLAASHAGRSWHSRTFQNDFQKA